MHCSLDIGTSLNEKDKGSPPSRVPVWAKIQETKKPYQDDAGPSQSHLVFSSAFSSRPGGMLLPALFVRISGSDITDPKKEQCYVLWVDQQRKLRMIIAASNKKIAYAEGYPKAGQHQAFAHYCHALPLSDDLNLTPEELFIDWKSRLQKDDYFCLQLGLPKPQSVPLESSN